MFKSASDRQHFIKREGSHSTKGFANGRVDVLPPRARETESLYADSKEQFESVERLAESIKKQIATVSPANRHMIGDLEKRLHDLSDTRARLAELTKAIGCEAYGWAFMCLAELRLPKDMFKNLDMEVQQLMGRKRSEVRPPAGVIDRIRKEKAKLRGVN